MQEARKRNGEEYPAASSAIQRYMRENGRPEVFVFDEKNIQFDKLRRSLDAKMKDLMRRGIGLHKKQDKNRMATPTLQVQLTETSDTSLYIARLLTHQIN